MQTNAEIVLKVQSKSHAYIAASSSIEFILSPLGNLVVNEGYSIASSLFYVGLLLLDIWHTPNHFYQAD